MATIDRYVDPDAAGAANGTSWADAYTSLNACEAAQQQDLTDGGGDVMVIHCRCSGGTADGTSLDINGWTASATCYIQIIVEDGYRHQGVRPSGNIYRLTGATAWDRTLTINESFVFLDYLAITKSTTDGNYTTIEIYPDVAAGRIRLLNCLIYDGNSIGIDMSSSTNAQVAIVNCFIYSTGSHGIRCSDEAGWNCLGRIYNTSIANAGDDGIYSFRGSNLAKNCYIGGSTNEDYDIDNSTLTLTTCYDEDGTGDTTAAFSTSAGAYFTNVTDGSEDLTIGNASSSLIGNGTDLTEDASYPFSTDWEDDDRSDWDIGADEYVAAAGGANYVPAIYHYQRMRVA